MRQSINFLGLIVLLILILIFISSIFRDKSKDDLVNPQPWAFFKREEPAEKEKTLKQVVDEVLQGSEGKYGLVVKNLKTGEEFNLNEDEVFQTA
ncbi:hypothetical protein HY383_04235, partial [Candidatus Daviesbacteria bacterium]|nr:hypothetical protein [Candidatus Daviesbacteria bacterium]